MADTAIHPVAYALRQHAAALTHKAALEAERDHVLALADMQFAFDCGRLVEIDSAIETLETETAEMGDRLCAMNAFSVASTILRNSTLQPW